MATMVAAADGTIGVGTTQLLLLLIQLLNTHTPQVILDLRRHAPMLLAQGHTTMFHRLMLLPTQPQSRMPSPHNQSLLQLKLTPPPSNPTHLVSSPQLPVEPTSTTPWLPSDMEFPALLATSSSETHGVPHGVRVAMFGSAKPPVQASAVSTSTSPTRLSRHDQI